MKKPSKKKLQKFMTRVVADVIEYLDAEFPDISEGLANGSQESIEDAERVLRFKYKELSPILPRLVQIIAEAKQTI